MASRYATSDERAFYTYEKNRLLSKILMATRCHWQLVSGGDAVVLSLKAINLPRLRRRRNGTGAKNKQFVSGLRLTLTRSKTSRKRVFAKQNGGQMPDTEISPRVAALPGSVRTRVPMSELVDNALSIVLDYWDSVEG
jgi:hypothetical protein